MQYMRRSEIFVVNVKVVSKLKSNDIMLYEGVTIK